MSGSGGVKYPLVEEFYSIQGEGYYGGTAAYFVRLAGCDVGCSWCDAKESWVAKKHPLVGLDAIAKNIANAGAKYVVITGGEPLLHDIAPLTTAIKEMGAMVLIETSGTQPISGSLDWVCLSPKKGKKPLDEMLQIADELKVVVESKEDFNWAEECAQKVSKKCRLYLQVEWSRSEQMMPQIVEYAKANPQWQISIQTHKYMRIP